MPARSVSELPAVPGATVPRVVTQSPQGTFAAVAATLGFRVALYLLRQPLPPFLTDLPHAARRIIPDQPVLAQAATCPPAGPSTCDGPSLPAWREAERTEVNSEVPHAVVSPCTADPAYRPDHLKLNVSRAGLLAELPRALSQAGTFGLQSQKASQVSGRTPIPLAVVRYVPQGCVLAETE